MTPPSHELRFTGAQVLRDEALHHDAITVSKASLSDAPGFDIDLSGLYILPGIIDLHARLPHCDGPISLSATDTLQRELRHSDHIAASSGITTAWVVQPWSWEGERCGPEFAENLLTAHASFTKHMRSDLRIQLQIETHTAQTQPRLIAAIREFGISYLMFSNRLHEAAEISHTRPDDIPQHVTCIGCTNTDNYLSNLHTSLKRGHEVPRYLCNIANECDMRGIKYGSSGDYDVRTRESFAMIGAKICEFPFQASAAAAAKTWHDPVLLSAPNVAHVRSHSEQISTLDLIRDGLCDALVSDGHSPSLILAIFHLADAGICSFAQAWAMISSHPARIMSMKDRGEIRAGNQADLTVLNPQTRRVEGTMVAGRWSYLADELAEKLAKASPTSEIAAE